MLISITRSLPGLDATEQSIIAAVHPAPATAVTIVYPGFNGSRDGYQGKYIRIAESLVDAGVSACVRLENRPLLSLKLPYKQTLVAGLRDTLEHVCAHAGEICGEDVPEIYLLGVSAGAGACAVVAADCPQVTKMLLLAPSGNAGDAEIEAALAGYRGVLAVAVGDSDSLISPSVLGWYRERARQARLLRTALVPGADHHFAGGRGERFLAQAPLTVFSL